LPERYRSFILRLPFGLKNIRLVTNAFNPNVIARPPSNMNAIEKQPVLAQADEWFLALMDNQSTRASQDTVTVMLVILQQPVI
jgi:hypothetical protein